MGRVRGGGKYRKEACLSLPPILAKIVERVGIIGYNDGEDKSREAFVSCLYLQLGVVGKGEVCHVWKPVGT
jgi:hypothetical protein